MCLHLVHLHSVCPGDNDSGWVKHWVKGGHNYYYNLNAKEGTWVEPEGFQQNNTQLNKEDIQVGSSTCAALTGFLRRMEFDFSNFQVSKYGKNKNQYGKIFLFPDYCLYSCLPKSY